jgi:CheY-like chemotaxis protein
MINQSFPELTPITCGDIASAQRLFEEDPVDLMIIDINLPDGNGIDFLCDIKTVYPHIPAIIMTAEPLPAYRLKAEEIGVIQFCEKPLSQTTMRVALRKAFNSGAKTALLTKEEIARLVSHIPILDYVQLKCLARKTCQLIFNAGFGKLGKVYLESGRITHAEAPGYEGLHALEELIAWPSCPVRENMDVRPIRRTIESDWSTTVAEAVKASNGKNRLFPYIAR